MVELNLDYNQLVTPIAEWFLNTQSLAIVIWSHNPWVCDCAAAPFAAVLESSDKYQFRSVLSDTVVCSDSYGDHQGQFIDNFSPNELQAYGTDSLKRSFEEMKDSTFLGAFVLS